MQFPRLAAVPEWSLDYLLTFVGGGLGSMARLGGYTTFSSFEYETQRLVELGAPLYAPVYVGRSVVLGFGAALLGVVIAGRF